MMDDRNYDTTIKLFNILNDIKGFDVAYDNPTKGRLIIRHNGTTFFMEIDPIYKNNVGDDTEPFDTVVERNRCFF